MWPVSITVSSYYKVDNEKAIDTHENCHTSTVAVAYIEALLVILTTPVRSETSVANPHRGQVSGYEAISIQIVSRFFTEYLDRYPDIKN